MNLRSSLILLAVPAAACGGGGSAATQTSPKAEGSLYDQFIVTHAATYEPEALAGTVTCFGGPAQMGAASLEMYVRRAFDADGGAYVEDSVSLFSANGDPIHYRTTMPYGGGAAIGPIEEVNGHYTGNAFVAHDTTTHFLSELDNHGARYYTAESVANGVLAIDTVGDTPDKMDAVGLQIPADDAGWQGAMKAFHDVVLDPAHGGLGVNLHAELAEIPAAQCDEMFTHFPPPARAW